MQYGVSLSAALHVALIVLALVGLPNLLNSDRPEITPIAVEMISPEELEKQTAKKPEPKKPEPRKPEPAKPKPAPPKVEKPPPAPPPEPEPEPKQALDIPKPEPMPPPEPAPEPEPVPKVEPLPKPLAKPEPPKPEPPKPEPPKKEPPKKEQVAERPPAPKPQRKPEAPKEEKPDEFQSLLKNLAKERERAQKEKADEPAQQAARPAEQGQERSPLERRRIAATLAQDIIQQVSPCWSIPAGVKDAKDMSVAIRIRLNPDGGLGAQPRIEDTGRMSGDPFFRALAESAMRALRNPRCMPLRLPYEQYDVWRDITFVFDPREALGP